MGAYAGCSSNRQPCHIMYTYAVSYYLHYVYILCVFAVCCMCEKKEEEEVVIYARTRRIAGPAMALTSKER